MYWCIRSQVGTTADTQKPSLGTVRCTQILETTMEEEHGDLGGVEIDSSRCDRDRGEKPTNGFCHILSNCEQEWIVTMNETPQAGWGLTTEICRNEEHFVRMVCWGAPKSGQRFKPAAANWNMVEYFSFPVTLELSVLNTENKLSIYVIVS